MRIESPKAALFIAIQAHLIAKVPELAYIDWDLGQLDEQEGQRPAVSFPCLLISVEDGAYENLGDLGQTAEVDVITRVAWAPFSGSSSLVPRETRHYALDGLNLEWKVNKALHGWSPDMLDTGEYDPKDYAEEDYNVMEDAFDVFGALIRVGDGVEKRNDGVRVVQTRYRVGYEDWSMSPTQKTASATGKINIAPTP